jgi:hypothetical protein
VTISVWLVSGDKCLIYSIGGIFNFILLFTCIYIPITKIHNYLFTVYFMTYTIKYFWRLSSNIFSITPLEQILQWMLNNISIFLQKKNQDSGMGLRLLIDILLSLICSYIQNECKSLHLPLLTLLNKIKQNYIHLHNLNGI